MKRISFLFILVFGLILTACSSPSLTPVEPTSQPIPQPTEATSQTLPTQPSQPAGAQTIQLAELTDSQGAVTVIVKPLDLNNSQDTLSFEVALDTHSIDLSMDLAALATLATDTGINIQAVLWDAPQGGHHVSGTLSFPATVDNKPILDGASKLTLIIKDLDAPERIFAWDLK